MAAALRGDRPQGRMMAWMSSTATRIMSRGLSASANNAGVTWLTRTSVHWAESSTATSRV